jgi:hypothetical protein
MVHQRTFFDLFLWVLEPLVQGIHIPCQYLPIPKDKTITNCLLLLLLPHGCHGRNNYSPDTNGDDVGPKQ